LRTAVVYFACTVVLELRWQNCISQ